MKAWEKVLSGRFLKKQAKSVVAMLVAVTLLLSMAPLTAFAMQVFIEVTVDDGQEYITLEAEPTDRIEDVKAKITARNGMPAADQILTFAGQVLEDGNTLQDYSIQKDSIIRLLVSKKVSFDANGGTNTMSSVRVADGSEYTLPECGFTPPVGKQFKVWSIGDAQYAVGDTVTVSSDITVKAVWENIPAEKPEVTVSSFRVSLTYGDNNVQISVTVQEKEGYEYSYQWYCDTTIGTFLSGPIEGATDRTYTLPNDLPADKHGYRCRVTAKRTDNGESAYTDCSFDVNVYNGQSSFTKVPEAKEGLQFNGQWQELVTAGTANGGTVQYLVTTEVLDASKINNYIFSSAIPKAANVGTYYVWYKIKGDFNHNDTLAENCLTVTVGKAQLQKPAENNTEFIYNGQEQNYFETPSKEVEGTTPNTPDTPNTPNTPDTPDTPEDSKSENDTSNDKPTGDREDSDNTEGSTPAPGAPTDPTVTFDPYAYDISGNKQTEVGTYTVKVSLKDKDNYEWADGTNSDLTYTFVIKPGKTNITGSVAIGPLAGAVTLNAEYTGDETVAYQWYCDGEVISGATGTYYTPPYDDIGKVFKVVVSGTGDYSGSVTAEYVHSKDLTQAVLSLSNTELIYNGQAQRPAVTVTYAGKVLEEGVDYEVFTWHESQYGKRMEGGISVQFWGQPVDSIDADSYYVQVKGKGNFESANSAPFTINPAPLTVTANDKTITYGDAPANAGVTYSGFAGGEDETVLGGTLTYGYSYEQFGDAGDYEITPAGLTADNYTITFVKGTLTVSPKETDKEDQLVPNPDKEPDDTGDETALLLPAVLMVTCAVAILEILRKKREISENNA